MYVRAKCIYAYGCELTIGVCMRIHVYVCVHKGTETYLCGTKRR